MMKRIFTLIFLVHSLFGYTQQTWYKCHGDANCSLDIIPTAICNNGSDRLIIAARLTGCPSSPLQGTFAAEYFDQDGNMLWVKQVSGQTSISINSDAAMLENGNIAFEYMYGTGFLDLSWSAFDTSGNYLFSRNIQGRNFRTKRLIPYKNSVFLTGYEWNDQNNTEGVIAKYNIDGTFQWVKCFGVPGHDILFNGGFVMGDNIYVYGSKNYPGFPGQYYGLIAKFNPSGDLLEEQYYQYFSTFEEVHPLPAGGFVCAVQTGAIGQTFVYFLEQDFTPKILWKFEHNEMVKSYNLDVAPDGLIYITGYYHLTSGDENPFILCFSQDGQYLWSRSNAIPLEGDYGIDISTPDDCWVWGAGYHASIQAVQRMDPHATAGNIDTTAVPFLVDSLFPTYYIKDSLLTEIFYPLNDTAISLVLDTFAILDSLCEWVAPYNYPGCFGIGFTENDKKNGEINIYPNPADDYFIIETNSDIQLAEVTVTIYDLQGQIVLEEKVRSDISKMNIAFLSKGIYILRINDGKRTQRSKLVKD
jgi:hypothetical protein